MRIDADRDTCIRAGLCVLYAGKLFDQDEATGLVIQLDTTPSAEQHEAARMAADSCPSGAITIIE